MKTLPEPMTVAEIADLVGGTAVGKLDCVIKSISTLAEAGPQDASFLENPKYGALAAVSTAGCLFLPPESKDAPCAAKARIFTPEPRGAFTTLVCLINKANKLKVLPTLSETASIHCQAVLGPGVTVGSFTVIEAHAMIGENTFIMPQCYVGANTKIGRNCLIYPQVVIREDCVIGDNVIIHPGSVIGADGFGFLTDSKTGKHTKIPQLGNVIIESNVEIGSNVTIDRAALGSTLIRSGTQIDNLVQIAHNVKLGRNCVVVAQVGIAGSANVGNNVTLAGQSGVGGHISVGDGATVAGQSAAISDVPPKAVMFGSPARPHREGFKLLALYVRLPEFYKKLKELEYKIGGRAAK